jgi:hypothetical protein
MRCILQDFPANRRLAGNQPDCRTSPLYNTLLAEAGKTAISKINLFENLKHSVEILGKLLAVKCDDNVKKTIINMGVVNCITVSEDFCQNIY